MNAITDIDIVDGRRGEWQQTSLGKKFWPADPRIGEIHISDIANGLAMQVRYAGQIDVGSFYSVAEHCTLMARWFLSDARDITNTWIAFAALLHDAAEAYLTDLPRAVKHAVGGNYGAMEDHLQNMIFRKYGLANTARFFKDEIKAADRSIVRLEKERLMRYAQPWAYDQFEPLHGVEIQCWNPPRAKHEFLDTYVELCNLTNTTPEKFEL